MSIELLKYILIISPMILVAVFLYVYTLLIIARALSGVLKLVASLIIYLVFACVLSLPIFYLFAKYRETINESLGNLLLVLVSYVLIVAPSLVYVFKLKIKELQNAGYFLPRN